MSTSLTAATLAVTGSDRISVIVSTLAGNGNIGKSDGTGTNAMFNVPLGVAVDTSGILFVADTGNRRICKITPSGVVTTLAGDGTIGFADGTGTNAKFNAFNRLTVDSFGNVFVADTHNHRVRKVTPSGVVTTIAGSTQGFADGTGMNAKFDAPEGIAVDASGYIFIGDFNNFRIRKVSPDGVVTTFAGSGSQGYLDATGTNAIFRGIRGVTFDTGGNLVVSDFGNHRIRRITPLGVVTTVAGDGTQGYADGTGTNAKFNGPSGVAVNTFGEIFVGDQDNNRIRMISTLGAVSTIAGSGTSGFADGVGTNAMFNFASGVAVDSLGTLYVADGFGGNRIRKILLPPTLPGPLPVCDSTWHHIALTQTSTRFIRSLAGVTSRSQDGFGTSASFYYPVGIAFDPYGNLVIGESWQASIRRINATTRYVETILNAPGLPGYQNTFSIVSSIVANSPSAGYATLYTGTTRVLSNGQRFQLTGTTGWNGFYSVYSIVEGVSITFGTANVNPTSTGIAYNYHQIEAQGVASDGFGNYYYADMSFGGIWMINASFYS